MKFHHTKETKQKIALAKIGDKNPAKRLEVRKKLSAKAKLRIGNKNPFYGKKHTIEFIEFISNKNKGRLSGNKNPSWNGGKPKCEECGKVCVSYQSKICLKCYREELKRRIGENSPAWRGGVTPLFHKIRHSVEYIIWRKKVFERDNYKCIKCGDDKGGNLEADHIKPFAFFPDLRFLLENGQTLCKICHKKTDTWGAKAWKFKI